MLNHVSGRRIVLSSFLVIVCLGACSVLSTGDKPAVTSWWLVPYPGMAQVSPAGQPVPVSVQVTAVPGLDTDRILTLTSDSELKPYLSARWVENLPELTGSLIGRSLEASGRFEVVASAGPPFSYKCELRLELRKFFSNLDSSGQTTRVEVAFAGQYQCGSSSPVEVRLNTSLAVHDSRMKNIVATFQKAMDSVTKDLLDQLSG